MRNLNECQAEVFRRSEKRIAERRQRRKRVITACVPLVLFLSIGGTLLMHRMGFIQLPDKGNATGQTSAGAPTGAPVVEFTGSVKVSNNGITRYFTDKKDVQSITAMLDQIVSVPSINNGKEPGKTEVYGKDPTDAKETDCWILVKRSNGTSQVYLLVESRLIDSLTLEEYHISEDRWIQLKKILGIPFH